MIFPPSVPFNFWPFVLPILLPLIVVSYSDRITEVKTNIYVTSFGPVSDTDMVREDTGCVFNMVHYNCAVVDTQGIQSTANFKDRKMMLFCCIFSFVAAFPSFIIASLLFLSTHNTEEGWVFHAAAWYLFIWQLSSYKLFKMSSYYSSHAFVYPGFSCLSFWSLRPPSHHIIRIPCIVEDPFSKWLNYWYTGYDVGVQWSGL